MSLTLQVYSAVMLFLLQGSNVVEDQDLLEIGILNSAHRQRLLQATRLLPNVSVGVKSEILESFERFLNNPPHASARLDEVTTSVWNMGGGSDTPD